MLAQDTVSTESGASKSGEDASSDGQSSGRTGDWLRLTAFAALAGAISTTAFFVSLGAVHLAAVLLAASAAATAAWRRPMDAATPPALAVVWGAGAGWCALVAGSSLDPIVEAGFRCGTGDIALLFFGVPMVFGGAATSFLVARKVLGGAASPSRSVWGWLRFAAWLAGLLLVVGAAERRLTHPAPSAYLDALPVVAVFPTPSSVRCIDERQPAGNTRCISPAREIGPLSATFECPTDAKRDCRVDVTVRSADPLADGHPTDLDVGRDESLVVRRDSAEHLYLIESGGVARRAVRDDGALVFFLRPSDVGHALGAPTEWIGLGAAALVLAAALAWLARRRQDRAHHFASLRSGMLRPNGWVELLDGTPPGLAAPVSWVGPVTVLGEAAPAGYRSAREALVVAPGAPSTLAAHELGGARAARVAAIAVFLVGLAPLVAALRMGLAI